MREKCDYVQMMLSEMKQVPVYFQRLYYEKCLQFGLKETLTQRDVK